MFTFNDFLERIDLDPNAIRLLRHDLRGVAAWRRGGTEVFGCFASFQKKSVSPYANTDFACHFLPGPSLPDGSATALFVDSTCILDRWDWDRERMPRLLDADVVSGETDIEGVEAFDLEWIERGQEYSERLLIRWGTGTRAWSQWASRHDKEILEIRQKAFDLPFPGFSGFVSHIQDIVTFPQSWLAALQSVGGVYLLVAENGEQYVDSAYGPMGFLGRWRAYQANGHGGNVLLREAGHANYQVSILEVASPDMSPNDIVSRENHWKQKLGTRAFGLNAN